MSDVIAGSHVALARGSKSFAIAARLLPAAVRDDAAVLYAFCRRADDAIDEVVPDAAPSALLRLREEVAAVYGERAPVDPELRALRLVTQRHGVPREYVDALLDGMQMDAEGASYPDLEAVLAYGFRVAGTVGLMMCHLLGLRDAAARRHAAHLGIAMQLTNIARDVVEDWGRGRLYLPANWLYEEGASREGAPWDGEGRVAVARVVARLVREADRCYASGDRGLFALPFRASIAVRVARRVYGAIGRRLERRGCDVTLGRVVVPTWEKLFHVAVAVGGALSELPRRAMSRFTAAPLGRPLAFPSDVLPV